MIIVFFLFFFCSTYAFSYPIIELPEKIFDQPTILMDNTTKQLSINSFLDNILNQRSSENELILSRSQSEILFYTPLRTKFYTANIAFGVDNQKVHLKSAQLQDSVSINYVSEFSKGQLIYSKRLSPEYGIGASIGAIEGSSKIDYALEGVIDIDEFNRFMLNYSNINLLSRFEFKYKTEEIRIPLDLRYSNTQLMIPLDVSYDLNIVFKVKLTGFSSEKTNDTDYSIGITGRTDLIEIKGNYRLNQDTMILVKLSQDISDSKVQFFSSNVRFGELNMGLHYNSISLGRKTNRPNNRFSFSPSIIKHSFNINFNGFVESWPFTSLFTEILGSGMVYNLSNNTILDIYELQLNFIKHMNKNFNFEIINSLFYTNSENGITNIRKRKSGWSGLLDPWEHENLSFLEELKDSFYNKISTKLTWKHKNMELAYSFGIFFPIRTGREEQELFKTSEEIGGEIGTVEIPCIHNLSINFKL